MALYHRDLGFPAGARFPEGRFRVEYGAHARQAAQNDRYGRIELLPNYVDLRAQDVVEAEIDERGTAKVVVRIAYSPTYDLCLALVPRGEGRAFAKTVWLNERSDLHSTCKYGRYVRP